MPVSEDKKKSKKNPKSTHICFYRTLKYNYPRVLVNHKLVPALALTLSTTEMNNNIFDEVFYNHSYA